MATGRSDKAGIMNRNIRWELCILALVILTLSGRNALAQEAKPTPTPPNEKPAAATADVKGKEAGTADNDDAADAKAKAQAADDNDGTDPTKPSPTSLTITTEYNRLRDGFYYNTLKGVYGRGISKDGRTTMQVSVPLANTNVLGDNGIGFGDIGFKVQRVVERTKSYGIVIAGEILFPTGRRSEHGSGRYVAKGTFIYAKFLKGGHIIAPSIVHGSSIAGDDTRQKINATVFDFYIVPRLKNKKLFMTIDPALTFNWENNVYNGALAVTVGRKLGEMFGGQAQIFVKPLVGIGGDRSFLWGFAVGYKVLGF